MFLLFPPEGESDRPANTKGFLCAVYARGESMSLAKGFWDTKRKSGQLHFFSEIIEQKYFLQALSMEQCVAFSFQIEAHDYEKMRSCTQL